MTILEERREAISKIYLSTDSRTVLNYLYNENTNFGVYVTHRVNEIRNNTNIEDWHYVQSKSNVTDDATRCRSFSDLNSNSRWFNGPEFIHENVITEPESCDIYRTDKTNLNINAITKTNIDIILSTETKPLINWCYYSSLSKLVRHLAWFLKLKRSWIRWKRGTKKGEDFSQLSVSELQHSRDILVRLSQMESYPTEYKALSFNQQITKNRKLLSFAPYNNAKKILCVNQWSNQCSKPTKRK